MLSNRALALAVGLAILPPAVHAAEDTARCVDASVPKHGAEEGYFENGSNSHPICGSSSAAFYAMNPLTPPDLPYGDKRRARQDRRPFRAAWCSSSTATGPARR